METKRSNMFKRVTALIAAVLMIFSAASFAACSKEEDKSDNQEKHKEIYNIPEDDSREFKALIDKYIDYVTGNYELVKELCPEDYWTAVGKTADEYIAELEAGREEKDKADFDVYGDGVVVTCEIVKEKHPDEDDERSYLLQHYNIADDRIEAVYYLNIDRKVNGHKTAKVDELVLRPVKIDGKWYLATENGSFDISLDLIG